MNKLECPDYSTIKQMERILGINNLKINKDIYSMKRDVYSGKIIKKGSIEDREETKINYSFEKLLVNFIYNGNKYGLIVPTEEFVVSRDYQYEKKDVVDMGDGYIAVEGRNKKPILLPYLFFGTLYEISANKLLKYLKQKLKIKFVNQFVSSG